MKSPVFKSMSLGLTKMKVRSPLAELVNSLLKEPEVVRMKRLSRFFHSFHLKNTVTSQVDGRRIELNGKPVINFGSANYLGFDQNPDIIEAGVRGLRMYGSHSGCSRIFSTQENLVALESELSELMLAEKTMVCANVSQVHEGAIPALFSGDNSSIYIDRFAHTSMFQAAQIAKAKGAKIHNLDVRDLENLKEELSKNPNRNKVLLVDGIYSMQGHMPPLSQIQDICRQTETILYIDDAHGTAVYGENGGGVVEALNLDYDNMIVVGSLQKGIGCFGGFISGHAALIDLLRIRSNSYIFSGAIQPQAVEASREAIRICRSETGKQLRRQLVKKSKYIRMKLQEMGFTVPDGDSPIIPVTIFGDVRTLMAGRKVYDSGVYLNSVLFPAVPKGQGILRISLTTLHSDEEIDALLRAFSDLKSFFDKNNSVSESFQWAKELIRSKTQGNSYSGF